MKAWVTSTLEVDASGMASVPLVVLGESRGPRRSTLSGLNAALAPERIPMVPSCCALDLQTGVHSVTDVLVEPAPDKPPRSSLWGWTRPVGAWAGDETAGLAGCTGSPSEGPAQLYVGPRSPKATGPSPSPSWSRRSWSDVVAGQGGGAWPGLPPPSCTGLHCAGKGQVLEGDCPSSLLVSQSILGQSFCVPSCLEKPHSRCQCSKGRRYIPPCWLSLCSSRQRPQGGGDDEAGLF